MQMSSPESLRDREVVKGRVEGASGVLLALGKGWVAVDSNRAPGPFDVGLLVDVEWAGFDQFVGLPQ